MAMNGLRQLASNRPILAAATTIGGGGAVGVYAGHTITTSLTAEGDWSNATLYGQGQHKAGMARGGAFVVGGMGLTVMGAGMGGVIKGYSTGTITRPQFQNRWLATAAGMGAAALAFGYNVSSGIAINQSHTRMEKPFMEVRHTGEVGIEHSIKQMNDAGEWVSRKVDSAGSVLDSIKEGFKNLNPFDG